ncbi:hypothetical protein [Bacteroides acidifaciens]|uniref:hypothetical protein n=1 Tax=Bacteroides acidifaciens TaxID=85831 RepID=UPI0026F267D7|nr:hypothetical protein [Bacteroides acidifaciens]
MLGLLHGGNVFIKPLYESILMEHSNIESSNEEELTESNDANKNNNAELMAQQYMRQPLSDAAAFSALYENGVIDKSYVSEYMASQTQDLKSTLSNLMGSESVNRAAMSRMISRHQINAWIDADKLLEWNKNVLLGNADGIPPYVELVKALLFNTKDLPSTIADGIYEDMCVNAIVCYHTAALVASVAKQDKPLVDKLKDTYDTMCDFYGENTNRGCNAFFNLCVAAIGILRAIILRDEGLPIDSICKSTAETVDMQFSNAWDNDPGAYYDITIGNTFRENYGKAFLGVLKRSEKRHGFCLGQDDANAFGIPYSVLIGNSIPSCNSGNFDKSSLNGSVERLAEGCENLMKLVESMDSGEVDLDSLVGNVQVESAGISQTTNPSDRDEKILAIISENEKKLISAIVSNNVTEAVQYLATNVVMEQEMTSWTRKIDSPVNKTLAEIRYKNNKYTSIVEANSEGLVSTYACRHREDILNTMFESSI